MKKISLFIILVGLIATLEAKEKKEPVVMTVAGKDVPLSEFIFMAKKDNSVDFKNKQSVKNYIELYKNYKLKVADAEALSIHQAPKFDSELEKYSFQLQQSYLIDKSGEDSAMRAIYERSKILPGIKQIYFSYPRELFVSKQILTKDTLELFGKANEAWLRIKNGESFEDVGASLSNGTDIMYSVTDYVYPFSLQDKGLEDYIYSMQPGDISRPVRSMHGFHLIKMDRIIPNPGTVRVSHIISAFPSENPTDNEIEETRRKSEEIYQKAIANEDFSALVLAFSDDSTNAKNGGMLEFGLGDVMEPIEKVGFALENIGDISKPFQTRYGFHILKLVDRKPEVPFEEVESKIYDAMDDSDRFFDLHRSFVEHMKVRHGYVFDAEAYNELKSLADEFFPTDSVFAYRGIELHKTLVCIDSFDFRQGEFVEYLVKKHRSAQPYSIDFMQDVFNFFIFEIVTEIERNSLERDYPDYVLQLKEYYDGILLFEISNKRVWSRPVEEQEQLEAEWVKELNEKYPVTINWKVINKIKKI